MPHDVNSRDPRTHCWVQSTKRELEGKLGSTFALSNGYLGLRGSHEEMPPRGRPEFYIAGTFTGGPPSLLGFHDPDHILTHPDRMTPEFLGRLSSAAVWTLPNLPNPTGVRLTVGGVEFSHDASKILSNERLLEIDKAILRRRLVFRDGAGRRTCVDSRRFVSLADRNLVCLDYRVTPIDHDAAVEAVPFINEAVANTNGVMLWTSARSLHDGLLNAVECVTNDTRITISIAQQGVMQRGESTVLTLFIAAGELGLDAAVEHARRAAGRGFETLLADHLAALARDADGTRASFDGDAATVQGFNFGQLHLRMALGPAASRAGVPIKGLTGHGYRFLNFWDMDFHMFPCFLMTRPIEARKLLEYRYGQLDAYRRNARLWGAAGAQVPWETSTRGSEETAPWLCLQDREIHISADAARMFALYDDLTPDRGAMADMGAEFIMETARFYASRVKQTAPGRYELRDVGCPDQYHTFADNNVFISLMARWNLQRAAAIAAEPRSEAARRTIGLDPDEPRRWQEIADNLYVIQPDGRGIIEEFDGFFGLSPDLDGICETWCRHSQAVKQPDVIAAFGPFEDLYSEEVRRRNWRFYADRTLHGSSLSLPGMAYAAARCGLNDEALDYLHKSTRMDLDDVNLDTERGVHVSGGAVQWYTVVFGFCGVTPRRDALCVKPNLPRQWRWLRCTVHWQFQRVSLELTRDSLAVSVGTLNDTAVPLRLNDARLVLVEPGRTRTLRL